MSEASCVNFTCHRLKQSALGKNLRAIFGLCALHLLQ